MNAEPTAVAAPDLDGSRFRVERLHADVVLLAWNTTLSVTTEDVAKLVNSRDLRSPVRGVKVLVELHRMITVSRQAFVLLAASPGVLAVACVGACPVEKVIIEHFRVVHRPAYPVKYFKDRDEALHWLSHQPGNNH